MAEEAEGISKNPHIIKQLFLGDRGFLVARVRAPLNNTGLPHLLELGPQGSPTTLASLASVHPSTVVIAVSLEPMLKQRF